MASTKEQRERIVEITKILETGASAISADGESITYDLASLRKELRRLQAIDEPERRPAVMRINLSNF